MADSYPLNPITLDHAKWFGAIINIFAQIETQMMVCAAGMLGTDLATAMILMADTSYRQKRQTIKHLNATIGVGGKKSRILLEILEDLHKLSTLRNQIAHCTWKAAKRPTSIKPMQLILRGEEPEPLGHWHNEKSYTLDELKAEARKLDAISKRFRLLLEGSGLGARVETKMAAIKPSTSARPGKPSSK